MTACRCMEQAMLAIGAWLIYAVFMCFQRVRLAMAVAVLQDGCLCYAIVADTTFAACWPCITRAREALRKAHTAIRVRMLDTAPVAGHCHQGCQVSFSVSLQGHMCRCCDCSAGRTAACS